MEEPDTGRLAKSAIFDQSRFLRLRRHTAENMCPSAAMIRVGALAERYRSVDYNVRPPKVCL